MKELLKINYEAEQPTVSARELYAGLEIGTKFTTWFERMKEYGFSEGNEFFPILGETSETGGRPAVDYQISVDMAKQVCMIQRSEKGKQYRQYFIDLEKAWNTPEQVMARALKLADRTIDNLKEDNKKLIEDNERMKPKVIFADAVSTSQTSILVGDLAKLLRQNGVDIGAKRLFEYLRNHGYLIKRKGSDWNMPTQKSMNMGLFEIKESTHMNGNGCNIVTRTPKATGRGQIYFVNKFLKEAAENEPEKVE
ncbi:phage antirepressor KilAC domain-containing protein [Clostridium sp.]|uniref:phage antirepressor KilAC domain-containing protein n=1 Tax=Clostridium sp. TaxID=1506 RepID=UPI00257C34C2|nr:phage antirepressor KilAC domain-containing protein [Clostridium sp.]MBS5463852.1 phage antirepressor KilAC domain-containing protein [Clostridium sp.]